MKKNITIVGNGFASLFFVQYFPAIPEMITRKKNKQAAFLEYHSPVLKKLIVLKNTFERLYLFYLRYL